MAKQIPGDVFQVISASDQLVFDRDKNVVGIRNRNGGDYFRFDQSDGAAKVGYQPEAGDATDVQTALRALDAGATAALSASGGAALVGYLPSGTGAVARTLEAALRDLDVSLKGYIPAGTDAENVDCTAYVQEAIDETPAGSTLMLDWPGVVLVDSDRDKYVAIASTGTTRAACALKVSTAITIRGTPACQLKLKPFSSAWAAMQSGDSVALMLVTASDVKVIGARMDCDADHHYETDGDGYKWWETGPTSKRPPDGIRVMPESAAAANVSNVVVEGCVIDRPLSGVVFNGNLASSAPTGFLTQTLATGCVENSVAKGNTISRHRGNSINFYYGVVSCKTAKNKAVNGMYHAIRHYSSVIDCESDGDMEYTDCDAVVARWNATDLGYWRTNKTGDAAFKVVRAGFCAGGEWNYVGSVHNIRDGAFRNWRGKFIPMASGHSTYYDTSSYYMGGANSVQTPPGYVFNGGVSDGYVYGASLYSTADTADRKPVEVSGCQLLNSTSRGAAFQNITGLVLKDCALTDNNGTDGQHVILTDCPWSVVDRLSFRNSTKTGDRYGIYVAGDATGVKVGRQFFDSSVPLAKRITQDGASTPVLPLPGRSVAVSGYANGWAAASVAAGIAGTENAYIGQNDGTVLLCLRLTAADATANGVFTAPEGLRPINLTGFTVTGIDTGLAYFGRIKTDGVVEIIGAPATETALVGQAVYSV
jgi:hypothetical protein